jgi:hypothetical protein
MKMTLVLLLIVLGFPCSMLSQVGGEHIYQFLNIATSARQIALGGKVLTLLDDVNQPNWNPATINNNLNRKLSINYTSYLAGINIGSLSYASKMSRRFGTLQGSIKYLDYGTMIGADAQGIETGNFSASDISFSIGYAYNIPYTNFYLGVNMKGITSNISNFSSSALASDIALLYHSPFKPFSLTLVVRNIGTQVTSYNGVFEKMPFEIALGGAYQLKHVPLKWYLTIDNLQKWGLSVPNPSEETTDLQGNVTKDNIGFIQNTLRHVLIGAELFPESLVNIRLGYNFRRSAELKLQNARTFSGISFGFGIQMNRFKFNYAHSKFHSATNTSTFSLEIDLEYSR